MAGWGQQEGVGKVLPQAQHVPVSAGSVLESSLRFSDCNVPLPAMWGLASSLWGQQDQSGDEGVLLTPRPSTSLVGPPRPLLASPFVMVQGNPFQGEECEKQYQDWSPSSSHSEEGLGVVVWSL